MSDNKLHWENIYTNKQDHEVSWFQEYPGISLDLVEKYCNGDHKKSIADIGGGNSLLVSELVKKGYENLCVLDISAAALERSRTRINSDKVEWINSDILNCDELNRIDIWHDRAVFHFLTDSDDIARYVDKVSETITIDGYLILGTFSETGPEKCSGLTVSRYSKTKFNQLFGQAFKLEECFEETHTTPFNTKQNFIWGVFRKK